MLVVLTIILSINVVGNPKITIIIFIITIKVIVIIINYS